MEYDNEDKTEIKPFEYYSMNGPTKIIIPSIVKIIGMYAFSNWEEYWLFYSQNNTYYKDIFHWEILDEYKKIEK
mgnify:CR=1 FL=1